MFRYCFVQLKPDADIEQVKKEISQIEFGTGKISVENKITRHEVAEVRIKEKNKQTNKPKTNPLDHLLFYLMVQSCI